MIEEILDSKVKIRIAKLFSERRVSKTVSDVSRILGISKSRASVCLRELNRAGLLQSRHVGRSVLYSLSETKLAKSVSSAMNQDKNLISQIKRDVLAMLKKHSPVSIAMFGSALQGLSPGKDVDIIVIHNKRIVQMDIYKISSDLTARYGIHISILAMPKKEFVEKARSGEEFVLNIIATHKLLYGERLEELSWQRK